MYRNFSCSATIALACLSMAGCTADNANTGQGALFGGLLGAGAGAVIGHATGNTAAGAAIGAGAGALTGAAVGAGQDDANARTRAAAQQAQAQATAQAVTVPDVVAMSQSHVDDATIINHIHAYRTAQRKPLQTSDVIYMHQQGVSGPVIDAMQATPLAVAYVPGAYPPPGPVYVGGGYYYHRPHYYNPPPAVGIGFSFR